MSAFIKGDIRLTRFEFKETMFKTEQSNIMLEALILYSYNFTDICVGNFHTPGAQLQLFS